MGKKKYMATNQLALKTTKKRTKDVNKNAKSKMFVFHGPIFSQTTPWADTRVQPQILWLIVRHYAISFRGPNCSFQYHVGISFRTESQCDYPRRLSLKKLKVFAIREQKRSRKKQIKQSLKTQYYNLIFYSSYRAFCFRKVSFRDQ